MKVTCMSCGNFDFVVEVSEMDFRRAPVVALTCPQCGSSTSLQERPGGGLQVALDKSLEKQRGQTR